MIIRKTKYVWHRAMVFGLHVFSPLCRACVKEKMCQLEHIAYIIFLFISSASIYSKKKMRLFPIPAAKMYATRRIHTLDILVDI